VVTPSAAAAAVLGERRVGVAIRFAPDPFACRAATVVAAAETAATARCRRAEPAVAVRVRDAA